MDALTPIHATPAYAAPGALPTAALPEVPGQAPVAGGHVDLAPLPALPAAVQRNTFEPQPAQLISREQMSELLARLVM